RLRCEQVVCASTRSGRLFHCKEQSRNNGRSLLQPTVCIALLASAGAVAGAGPHRSVAFSSLVRRSSKPFVGSAPTQTSITLATSAASNGVRSLKSPNLLLSHKNPPAAAAACVRATKKPGAASRPGGCRNFDEYAFLEDSRYASQEESG